MNWSNLNNLQIGKYGEYLAKMEFTKCNFDVYGSEIDDKEIDFVIRNKNKQYFDIQVKSIRTSTKVVLNKGSFDYLALVILKDEAEPIFLMIPSVAWRDKRHSSFFIEKDRQGKKEFILNISSKSIKTLQSDYSFETQASLLGG